MVEITQTFYEDAVTSSYVRENNDFHLPSYQQWLESTRWSSHSEREQYFCSNGRKYLNEVISSRLLVKFIVFEFIYGFKNTMIN